MNYLNYLKTEHIIDIMLALHSDHQEQMRNVVDVISTSKWEMIIIILQKNSIKMKNIQKKLHKLRVLYELNKRRNNKLMLWRKMRSLTEMIEKLMHQCIAASTVNQRMKNQLKRLKKIISKLEKKFMKKKKHVDSWAKRMSMKLTTSFESHLMFNINIKKQIDKEIKEQWLIAWNNSIKKENQYQKHTARMNLSYRSLKKFRKINRLTFLTFIQLKLRHEYFKSYLHQLSKNNSNKCYEICKMR